MVDKAKMAAWAKANTSKLFLGGMALLLVLRILLYLQESDYVPPRGADIQEEDMTPIITPESPEYEKVQRLIVPRERFEQSEYNLLAEYNMFDPKIARDAPTITAQANQIYNSAKQQFDQGVAAMRTGNVARARDLFNAAARLVNDALARQPNHAMAQNLRTQIQEHIAQLDQGVTAPGEAGAAGAVPAPGATPATEPGA